MWQGAKRSVNKQMCCKLPGGRNLSKKLYTYVVFLVPVTGLTSTRPTQVTVRPSGTQKTFLFICSFIFMWFLIPFCTERQTNTQTLGAANNSDDSSPAYQCLSVSDFVFPLSFIQSPCLFLHPFLSVSLSASPCASPCLSAFHSILLKLSACLFFCQPSTNLCCELSAVVTVMNAGESSMASKNSMSSSSSLASSFCSLSLPAGRRDVQASGSMRTEPQRPPALAL